MHEKRARRTLPQNYVTLFAFNGPEAPRRPQVKWRPRLHSLLLSATMQTGESSQIQDCSSGKLSKAFHTSTATVTAVRRELCFRKAKKNHNNWGEPERAPHEREVWCQDVQYVCMCVCMCVYLVRLTSRRARVHACAKR